MKNIISNGLVSVVMPAYNAGKYIAESIESVIKQNYNHWELIIVDDCSSDETVEIIKSYQIKDKRIKLVSLEENQGVANARNVALSYAKGEYVAFLDSDDIWFENKLEKQIKAINNSSTGMVCTGYEMIDSDGVLIKKRNIKSEITFKDLLKENTVIFSSTLFLKKMIANQCFNKDFFHEDYIFLLEFLRGNGQIIGIDETLVRYRVQNSGKSFNKFKAASNRWYVYRRFLKFNFFKSSYYFVQYAVHGVVKYK